MNYLGHLFFSKDDPSLMTANLFGDFVKGKDISNFPTEIQYGIRLHRNIDSFMDTNVHVRNMLHVLYDELPKVAGIAADLYFDHLLAKRWKEFHSSELTDYLKQFYKEQTSENSYYTPNFQKMIKGLIQYDYMRVYPTINGLDKMCKGVAQRISFPNQLPMGQFVFLKHQELIEMSFENYMQDAITYFKNWNFKILV